MEMAHNAIEWGNLHQSDRLVNITYRVHDDRLEIVVRDQGPGFDRTSCRTPPSRATRSLIWTSGKAGSSCRRIRPLDLSRHGR